MKEKIKTFLYILFPIWVLFVISTYARAHYTGLILSISVGFVISSVLAWAIVYTVYNAPKKIETIFSGKTFQTFIKNGFERNDNALIGTINNYTIIFQLLWNLKSRPAIEVIVLFDPESYGHYFTEKEFKALVKRNDEEILFGKQNQWTVNSISNYVLFGLLREPSFDKLVNKASELIDVLMEENLKPISYSKLSQLQHQV